MTSTPTRCGYCNAEIEQPKTGRPRRYCNRSHQQAAYRQRAIAREVETPCPPELAAHVPAESHSSDEYVAATLLEARRIAGALHRLGTEARPALAWRCATAAEGITATLNRSFDGIA
jgi:hypothetical protein